MLEPEVETRDWAGESDRDDTAYRAQIERLFANSRFYREKLVAAGFADAASVGALASLAALPFTEKDDLRATRSDDEPIGTHLCCPPEDIARIYSTSGTTGTPSFIPLTRVDIENWLRISARSYATTGLAKGERVVTSYNAGPFVAGAALAAFDRIGACHIPVGTGNTDRLLTAIRLLKVDAVVATPSYGLYLAEKARERGFDLTASSVRRLIVAGEPGGGEPAFRARLEEAWGARVTEAMGIGDISVSLWGECEEQAGMHFSGRGLVHFELIEPDTGRTVPVEDGAMGELVYTHLAQEATPLLRFRSRDHVVVRLGRCRCGRTSPRVRCIGRTDDMLIVRGVNVFPTAVRELVGTFAPTVSGVIAIRPPLRQVKQDPPLPLVVKLSEGAAPEPGLVRAIETRIREALVFTAAVDLVPFGTLARSEYKSKLVEWPGG